MFPSIPDKRFSLRWRFDYAHKSPKVGMWDDSGHLKIDQAWCQPINGLQSVKVEAKDLVTKETKVIVECNSQNFRMFQWLAVQRLNPSTATNIQRNIGICLMTNDCRVEVYNWGEVRKRPLINGESKMNFATDGR
jgi:hypothetical protein